jgi:hypothetical protein
VINASCSSTDQDGRKRRGIVRIHRKLREIARSLTGGSEKEEEPPVIRKIFQTKIRSLESERAVQVPFMQPPAFVPRYLIEPNKEAIMQTVRNIAARLGVAGAIAAVSVIPASAFEAYVGPRHHHHYYDYYGGGNGCRPGWTVQGGVCKPYRYGPWDIYGGRQSDWGY